MSDPGPVRQRSKIAAALADRPAQQKVAVFVVRNVATTPEVIVFWHPGGGWQLPAGTVEADESFEQAAHREAIEETGLADVELIKDLGSREMIMPPGQALLLEEVHLQLAPGGARTRWRLWRGAVDVLDLQDDWALVRTTERDLDHPELVIAQLTGWVPSRTLSTRQERRFFLATSQDTKINSWQQQGEPEHTFTVCWQPIRPAPDLVDGQRDWLELLDAGLRRLR